MLRDCFVPRNDEIAPTSLRGGIYDEAI